MYIYVCMYVYKEFDRSWLAALRDAKTLPDVIVLSFGIYIYIYLCISLYIYTHTHVYIYIYIYIYIYVCVCVCVYMYKLYMRSSTDPGLLRLAPRQRSPM